MRPAKVYINKSEALTLAEQAIKEGWSKLDCPSTAIKLFSEYYEGYGYHIQNKKEYVIDKEVFTMYLQEGIIDADLRKPIMDLATGLRYVKSKGLPSNYTLRELREDLKDKGWLTKKGKGDTARWYITRSYLNKFIGEWYGYR